MIDLNGLNKVSVREMIKDRPIHLDSVFEESGLTVEVFIKEKIVSEELYIITSINGVRDTPYYPNIDMRIYANKQRLASKNIDSLAKIYHNLLK